jgi:lipopolysaccharide transport system ATP-binding protein
MTVAIATENLSKRYLLTHQQNERYLAARDELTRGIKNILSMPLRPWVKSLSQDTREEFWALKNINFEIRQGDRVGIIGRNGAGKSTLLKILSRITEPTQGRIRLRGRIASLLEVGTGFHPELTGRENIFLNGAILGMSKSEIKSKFDEIISFADVERFLDTPVKRYSSGMYVRLAFSIAAHLEPDILIVDEVLAVGDHAFQEKSLGKMEDIGRHGRTILFVSHNINAISRLTNSVIVLENGEVNCHTNTEEGIDRYLESCRTGGRDGAISGMAPWLTVRNLRLENSTLFASNESPLEIRFEMHVTQKLQGGAITIGLINTAGARIATGQLTIPGELEGVNDLKISIERPILTPGTYFLRLAIWSHRELALENDRALRVDIVATSRDNPNLASLAQTGKDKFGCYMPLTLTQVNTVRGLERNFEQ